MTESEMAVNAVKSQAQEGDKALIMADLIQARAGWCRRLLPGQAASWVAVHLAGDGPASAGLRAPANVPSPLPPHPRTVCRRR